MLEKLDGCCTGFLQKVEHFLCICEDGIIVWINDAGVRLLRAPGVETVIGTPLAVYVSDDFADLFNDGLGLLADETEAIPLNLLTVTAEEREVKLHVTELGTENGHIYHFVECQDISDLIRASQDARGREDRIHAILEAVDQAVITIDEFGIISDANEVAENVFGYKKSQMLGQNVTMLMPEPYRSRHDDYLLRYHSSGEAKIINETRELEGQRADGSLFPMELTVTEVMADNGRKNYIGGMRDISIRKAQEERIRFLALHDQLTGLPNRASFNDAVEDAVSRARRAGTGVALMFIDLDKFKPINDTLGHEAGDIVLKTVAERLNEIIRKTDTAARLGGDEFVLILENVAKREDVVVVAKTLLEKVPALIDVGETTCSVGLSIGISHFPSDAESIPELLNAADTAMYNVKKAGRNNYAFC